MSLSDMDPVPHKVSPLHVVRLLLDATVFGVCGALLDFVACRFPDLDAWAHGFFGGFLSCAVFVVLIKYDGRAGIGRRA